MLVNQKWTKSRKSEVLTFLEARKLEIWGWTFQNVYFLLSKFQPSRSMKSVHFYFMTFYPYLIYWHVKEYTLYGQKHSKNMNPAIWMIQFRLNPMFKFVPYNLETKSSSNFMADNCGLNERRYKLIQTDHSNDNFNPFIIFLTPESGLCVHNCSLHSKIALSSIVCCTFLKLNKNVTWKQWEDASRLDVSRKLCQKKTCSRVVCETFSSNSMQVLIVSGRYVSKNCVLNKSLFQIRVFSTVHNVSLRFVW